MGDVREIDVCVYYGVFVCILYKKVNYKNKRRKRYMYIKYEMFEDRDEGDFCNIEKV